VLSDESSRRVGVICTCVFDIAHLTDILRQTISLALLVLLLYMLVQNRCWL
jgi:hypothetical protein